MPRHPLFLLAKGTQHNRGGYQDDSMAGVVVYSTLRKLDAIYRLVRCERSH
jgi:hypothetical protein